ncbi:MAG: hypothetical protein RLZZ626_477 [Actinomycetota bacterium]
MAISRSNPRSMHGIRLYATLAAAAVLIRLGFGVLFGSSISAVDSVAPGSIAFSLGDISLQVGFGQSLHILGSTTWAQLHQYTLLGLRLAAVIAVVGLANTLSNPRALLRSTPAALYPVATALSMALNIGPQLLTSAARVRRAQRLRTNGAGRTRVANMLVPVLADALDRSLALAANMQARGFGSGSALSDSQQKSARLGLLSALCLFAPASYLVASGQLPLAIGFLAAGLAGSAMVFRTAARANRRTSLNQSRRGWRDWLVMAAGAGLAASSVAGWWPA